MISKKDISLVTNGKKLVEKFKSNFSNFVDHPFYVRIILVDEEGKFKKAIEYIVDSEIWMDYLSTADFGDLKVDKIEFSAR